MHSYFSTARVNNEALSPTALSASGQNIAFPPVALWVTVGLAVCLLVLLIALAAVCRRKIKESCEEAKREGGGNGEVAVHMQHQCIFSHFMGDDLLKFCVESSRLDKRMF